MRTYEADGITMRLDFFEEYLRVALIRTEEPLIPTWSVCPGVGEVPIEGRDKLSTEGFRREVQHTKEELSHHC